MFGTSRYRENFHGETGRREIFVFLPASPPVNVLGLDGPYIGRAIVRKIAQRGSRLCRVHQGICRHVPLQLGRRMEREERRERIRDNTLELSDNDGVDYALGDVLYSGAETRVVGGVHSPTGAQVAVKLSHELGASPRTLEKLRHEHALLREIESWSAGERCRSIASSRAGRCP
jgi:hypothetical protein